MKTGGKDEKICTSRNFTTANKDPPIFNATFEQNKNKN